MSMRAEDIQGSSQITVEGPDGELRTLPVVTRHDLMEALQRLAIVLDLEGGCGSIVLERIPTGVPNESVTVRAIMTRQPFTNARPRPEPNALAEQMRDVSYEAPATEAEDGPTEAEIAELEAAAAASPEEDDGKITPEPDRPQLADDVGDGLEVDPQAVDESDLPAGLRTG